MGVVVSSVKQFEELAKPIEFIHKWARYSRGMEEAPPSGLGRENVTYTTGAGVKVFGRPLDPRRLIKGYLRPGDEVFVWGHSFAPPSPVLAGKSCLLRDIWSFTPTTWLGRCIRYNWDPQMNDCVGMFCVIGSADGLNAAGYAILNHYESWSFVGTCLALPLNVHLKRVEELGDKWPITLDPKEVVKGG